MGPIADMTKVNSHKILVKNLEGKRTLERPLNMLECYIEVHLHEIV